jgi:hypothetical protein
MSIKSVSRVQRIGGVAAFIYAGAAIATLGVAFGLIGPAALADRQKLVDLALTNPTPLLIQDILKFIMAIVASGMIAALFVRLQAHSPILQRIAALSGLLAVLSLVLNASLSLFTLSQASNSTYLSAATSMRLAGVVGLLGLTVIVLHGVWYLLVNWTALRQRQLPNWLSYLGIGMGVISLVPVLGILVLLCSIVWSVGIGQVLLEGEGAS